MNPKRLAWACAAVLGLYVLLAAAFYGICGEQLRVREDRTDMLEASGNSGEITSDVELTQRLAVSGDELVGLTLYAATYDRTNTGVLRLEIANGEEKLGEAEVDVSTLADNSTFDVAFEPPIKLSGTSVELRITAPQSAHENAITLYAGNTISAAHNQVGVTLSEEERLHINGTAQETALCTRVRTRKHLWFGRYYWAFALGGLALLVGYCGVLLRKNRKGERSLTLNMISAFTRYRYLIKQLVARDFKTKYKRSVLGMLWSLLNPLLTMAVQYVVFSTLFRSDIPNFPVYLLTGIVCYSFFSEATSMALASIVGNAALITKVYVPKYIYPLTRVMSSTVNFLLALLPLFAMLLATGTPIRASILLLPLGVLCLFALCLGVGMFLASAMVFFRDTQFLWGVVSMMWMYLTPIFYPESIIPASIMPLYKCNPLYQIIRFIRIVLMNGLSPEPKAYALMLLASFVPLALGALVFKRTQDKFVLNI